MLYGWSPTIGDPGVLGWATVALYFAGCALCLRAAGRTAPGDAVTRRCWHGIAALLLLLGMNKQLDLQSLLTAVARHAAQAGGWYAHRRLLQALFVGIAAVAGLAATGWLVRSLRGSGTGVRIAGAGCAALIAFIVIRAASFHHVDLLLGTGAGGVRINHVLEIGAISVIAGGALLAPAAGKLDARQGFEP